MCSPPNYIYLLQSFLLPILRYLDVFTCTHHTTTTIQRIIWYQCAIYLVKWRSCMTNFRPLKFESVCVIYTSSVEWTKQKSGHRSADVRWFPLWPNRWEREIISKQTADKWCHICVRDPIRETRGVMSTAIMCFSSSALFYYILCTCSSLVLVWSSSI